MFHLLEHVGFCSRLILGIAAGNALDDHVAAKLAGQDYQGPIEQAARLQVENQSGHGPINLLLHARRGRVTVFMRIPIEKRDVFGRHFDKPCPRFHQATCQQAALAKPADVVTVEALFRFQGEVERFLVF